MKDEQFTQILRAFNDIREDIKEFKGEMNRRWEENNKRWEENDKRWEENERRWKVIDKELAEINNKVDRNYRGVFTVFDRYEDAAESMYQENRQRIIAIENKLKIKA